ncbi:MAG TPA: hypothetical protein VFN76_10750 [Candidatus Limnocylindria bacterium]|nr:hypothetical protein [Candidatus Limnocylindria bacterium]
MRSKQALLIAVTLVMLAACSSGANGPGDDADDGSDAPLTTRPPFGTMPPLPHASGGTGSRADIPDAAWSAITADLDSLLHGVDPDQIEVVSVEEVTWNSGALGCPEPGQVYTQALVDGLRVIVAVDSTEYDFRVVGSTARLCE